MNKTKIFKPLFLKVPLVARRLHDLHPYSLIQGMCKNKGIRARLMRIALATKGVLKNKSFNQLFNYSVIHN
jgi:hypothetical protein